MKENDKNTIKIFENQNIRTVWDNKKEDYYFNIIDIIKALTGSKRTRKYWSDLKNKLKIDRAIIHYKSQGYNDAWIEKRLKGILHRFKLTTAWKNRGINKCAN